MALKNSVVWLGGLFTPEAYITATRQYVAQANSWSLEELVLCIQVVSNIKQASLDECAFPLVGLTLQGAKCNQNGLIQLSASITNDMPVSVIRWSRKQEMPVRPDKTNQIQLPVYLNATRSELLFTLNMDTDQAEHYFYTRGVAIMASKLH